MKRILITGSSGAGKTTLARRLAQKYDLPLINLDQHFWQPNWEKPDMEAWHSEVSELVKGDKWVIEGNYASTFDVRFPRATTLIHFDLPRVLCLYRCIKQRIKTGRKARSDMAEGCIERFEWNFYKYVWSYPAKHSPKVFEDAKKLFSGELVVLKSSEDVFKLEESLKL
ncbi:MAG: hypothetical protein HON90_13005 [Halobacteriovoraceae bacterium]|jgi:adenylate kinase family enzyme|nr:hypothetical protein [Halobacteriovoraceae bacterium]